MRGFAHRSHGNPKLRDVLERTQFAAVSSAQTARPLTFSEVGRRNVRIGCTVLAAAFI
jgi:hypothetical protein